ncbi:hypothetical protein [Chamaesiphon polymorphus]|uniref:Uncharacterized protein n=1 Tax=Chamaesiphon polymorphus CCALA 037 TaxID=2107692 RepID=A0A2T1F8A0_9CYAN|nr:hypothetical protein [Chamaesiphon polymorphus]PSB41199.1 hypothetical protein C7B77_27610 [Chamaesiphon polymorphus CCALA 037]
MVVGQKIVEIFDSLAIDESPILDSFDDKLFYYTHALFTLVWHQRIIDFFKSKLSLSQYIRNLESRFYSEAERDRIKLAAAKLTSIPGIDLKIARESKRFLSKYKSRQHRETLEYILRIAQSQLPAYRVSLYGFQGLMSKEEFLTTWFSRGISYQENPISFELQPGDLIILEEGEFILNKDLVPLEMSTSAAIT